MWKEKTPRKTFQKIFRKNLIRQDSECLLCEKKKRLEKLFKKIFRKKLNRTRFGMFIKRKKNVPKNFSKNIPKKLNWKDLGTFYIRKPKTIPERKMYYEHDHHCKSTHSNRSKSFAHQRSQPAEHQFPDHGRNNGMERYCKCKRLAPSAK